MKQNYFDNAIADTTALKSFKYKTKIIESTVAANEILEDAKIFAPLKYLSNCWRLPEIRWTKHCVLTVTANDNNNDIPSRIVFTIKDTKIYVPTVTLSGEEN